MREVARRTTFWLLWTVVFTLPWQGSIAIPGLGTATRVVGLLAAAVGISTWALHGRARRWLDVHLILAALTGWAVLSLLWTADAELTTRHLATMLQLLLLLLLLWDFAEQRPDLTRLRWAWVLGGYLGSMGLITTSMAEGGERAAAFGFDANDLGTILALGIPIAWQLRSHHAGDPIPRLVATSYLPVGGFAVLLTGSRGALLVLIVSALVVVTPPPRTHRHGRVSAVVALLAIGALATLAVPQATLQRLATIPTELRDGDLNDRTPMWHAALEVLDERPVTGSGAGTSELETGERTGAELGVHNTYLSLGLQLGAVGAGLFLLALLGTELHRRRGAPTGRAADGVLLLALVVAMFPLHWEQQKAVWIVLALVLAGATEHRGAPLAASRPPHLTSSSPTPTALRAHHTSRNLHE